MKNYKSFKTVHSDVKCGLLQCNITANNTDILRENLQRYAMFSVLLGMLADDVNGIYCSSGIFDVGIYTTNPGFVPDGASCGSQKVVGNFYVFVFKKMYEAGKLVPL